MFCFGAAVHAQTNHSIAALQHKNNIKFTLANFGYSYFQTPFWLNDRAFLGFEYEGVMSGRHAFTMGTSLYYRGFKVANGKYLSNTVGADMGYRWYGVRFDKSRPLNGLYVGGGLTGYFYSVSYIENGARKNVLSSGRIVPYTKLGVQTHLSPRIVFNIEGRIDFPKYWQYNPIHYYTNVVFSLGYSF